MDNHVVAQMGKMTGFGLVRNAKGEPQFSDYVAGPEIFRDQVTAGDKKPILTEEDWTYINLKRKEL
jgi:hypothetical protein